MNVLFLGQCDFLVSVSGRDMTMNVWNRLKGSSLVGKESYQTIWGPLSRMLYDILEDDHIQWHPPLIRHHINFWPVTDQDLITEFDF